MCHLKVNQIGLVSAISLEIANQHDGIKISQKQLNAIIQAANLVVAAFSEPDSDHNSDSAPDGCQHLGDS